MLLRDFKKLVSYARTAGILVYKSPEVEFTLSINDPKQERITAKKTALIEDSVRDTLAAMSEEDLLLYSSQGMSPEKDV